MFKHIYLWSSQPWSEKVHSLYDGKHSIWKLNWQHYCKQVTIDGSALNGGICIFINPLPRLRKHQQECMEWQLHSWARQLWLPAEDLWVIKPMRSGNSWKGSTNWTKWVIPKEKENMKETYWRPSGGAWGFGVHLSRHIVYMCKTDKE